MAAGKSFRVKKKFRAISYGQKYFLVDDFGRMDGNGMAFSRKSKNNDERF